MDCLWSHQRGILAHQTDKEQPPPPPLNVIWTTDANQVQQHHVRRQTTTTTTTLSSSVVVVLEDSYSDGPPQLFRDRPRTRAPPRTSSSSGVSDKTHGDKAVEATTTPPTGRTQPQQLDTASAQTVLLDHNVFSGRDRTTEPPPPTGLPTVLIDTRRPSPGPATLLPTTTPSQSLSIITYQPGNFSLQSTSDDGRIRLSNGLSARRIATSGQVVVDTANTTTTTTNTTSNITTTTTTTTTTPQRFHLLPDAAAIFVHPTAFPDSYFYVSNAEVNQVGDTFRHGGVGVLELHRQTGAVVHYRRILNDTRRNCGGGKTPWNTWISCEETTNGRIHQVDPFGNNNMLPQPTALGELGWYESFAYHVNSTTKTNNNNTTTPTFYVTRDREDGVLTRFTPNAQGMACFRAENAQDRWCTLNHGTLDYLEFLPDNQDESDGTSNTGSGQFQWTTVMAAAEHSASRYYPFSEGIDIVDDVVYFTSKSRKRLIVLQLHNHTYEWSSTQNGAFDHQPDQIARLVPNTNENDEEDGILYFCEDGGRDPGVHGRSRAGQYFTILYGAELPVDRDETSGLCLSPDRTHMYVTFQHSGFLYDVTRDDRRPFGGATLDIKYHAMS